MTYTFDNIYTTPEHTLLRDQVARFIAREVEPFAEAWEQDGKVPREVLRKMGQAGLLGLMYDPELGGGGADAMANLVFAEALSQSTFAGFIITVLVHTDMASPHLHHAGTAAQKAKYMPRITSGECITAVGVSEPGAGSDVAGIRTVAKRDGDHWVLNGTKMFITNGVHADLYFIAAKTGEARHAMSMFIVEKGTPGFSVGRALKKTGWLSSDTAELVFDNGSNVSVGTSMRGGTLQYLHISEYGKISAKYPDKAKEIKSGSFNAVKAGQFIFVESTAALAAELPF